MTHPSIVSRPGFHVRCPAAVKPMNSLTHKQPSLAVNRDHIGRFLREALQVQTVTVTRLLEPSTTRPLPQIDAQPRTVPRQPGSR